MINENVKTIYLHVGMLKTGTSSIQATMANNTDILKQYGFYYSTKLAVNHSDYLLPIFLDDPTDFHVERERKLSLEFINNEYKEKKAILERELYYIQSENLIFSAEGLYVFSYKTFSQFRKFLLNIFPHANIKIVLCLRNPSEYLASEYQQFIRTSYCSNWQEKIKEQTIYKKEINYFKSLFGNSNLIVYDFEDAKKHNFGLVGYFLQNILGLSERELLSIKILRDNDSISNVSTTIIHYINKATESPVTIFEKERLKYERYLNDTQALWSLKGNKFKLNKVYVEELYKKLEPELQWLRENFNIDYNLSNATYTEQRYKIPNSFFVTIKEAFPKLSRIVRRAFYDWLSDEIKTREDDEYQELEKTKIWIEKNYKALVETSLDELKKQLNKEIEACKSFFDYFKIENKQSYQLYYHLHLLLKEVGEYKAANGMLQNLYEKNPYWNEEWEVKKTLLWKGCIKSYFGFLNNSNTLLKAIKVFKNTFEIKEVSNQQIQQQLDLFLNKHNLKGIH